MDTTEAIKNLLGEEVIQVSEELFPHHAFPREVMSSFCVSKEFFYADQIKMYYKNIFHSDKNGALTHAGRIFVEWKPADMVKPEKMEVN